MYSIFPSFSGIVGNYRADIKSKFAEQANIVRTAISIKCIENFLRNMAKNKEIVNYKELSLSDLIDKFDAIEMNLEMIENLFSGLGKDININVEYESGKNKKIYNMNTKGGIFYDDQFDVIKAISDLFNRPVFFYEAGTSIDKREKYIFKKPDNYNIRSDQVDNQVSERNFWLNELSPKDRQKYDAYLENELRKNGSNHILLYSSDFHALPLGLNKNGEKYNYNAIDIKINSLEKDIKNMEDKAKIEVLSYSSFKNKIDEAKNKYKANNKNNKKPKTLVGNGKAK